MSQTVTPENLLLGLPGNRGRELAAQIHGLTTALGCVTAEAGADVIHGRIDSLIQEHRMELQAICSQAVAGEGEGAHHA